MSRVSTSTAVALVLAIAAAVPAVHARQQPDAGPGYVFAAGTGVLLFHVRPDHAGVFEQIMARITDGLRAAAPSAGGWPSWRFFRARPEADSAVYVAFIDPVDPGADYDPVKLLTQVAPAEARTLYEQLRAAVLRVERLDLEALR